MCRIVPVIALLATGPAFAQYPPSANKDGVVKIELSVSPAKEPVPASKFNVYPEYRDQQPGNRVQGLLRTFMEQDSFFANKERNEQRDKWSKLTLADLPADVREQAKVNVGLAYDDKYTKFLGIADRAARFSRIEWNEYFDLRNDGINFLLPEVQKMRALAAAIQLRMRGEIKNGEWHRAAESVKTLFGIAQALEQHPTLIGSLVGIAIFQIGLNGVEEMVGQPGCPSLYWSLTDVPNPPVSTRVGLAGERLIASAQFQSLRDAHRPLGDGELTPYLNLVAEMARLPEEGAKGVVPQQAAITADPKGWYAKSVGTPEKLAAARTRITGRGTPANVVGTMSAVQVGLLNDLYLYEEMRDDVFKWYHLPGWQSLDAMRAADNAIKARAGEAVLGPLLVPATYKAKSAETRIAQRTALLRAVEAVRLHVGATGQLPATLADTKLPEPLDPVTGKPFSYTVKDGVAILRGENSSQPPATFIVEYTIRLRP